ncbi:Helicase C-terminal [Penicillium brevicompactum]|uniref:Helicase C-terminal n=1 Tax=Penicillium brevicompactum TaxID=5074 RepID=UPI00253F6FE8|nr:Helicase C-terminal [Penicillium brevicompactum]KAJ5349135.1 Helicase C-terminal [Penicillium brevicompactum]
MESHPAMLLDPKGARRQTQRNGNHPDSHSPSHDLPPMDPIIMAGEPPKDPPDNSTSLPDLLLPELPGLRSPASPQSSMDPSVSTGKLPAESCEMATSQLPLPLGSANTPALASEHVLRSHLMDPGALDTQVPVATGSAAKDDDPSAIETSSPETFDPHLTFLPSTPLADTMAMSAESTEPVPDYTPQDSIDPSPLLSTAKTFAEDSESPGLLLEYTGKQPMAPAGTATVTPIREPKPRTPIAGGSGASSSVPKPIQNMEFQFTTANDDESESDAKRSYHEISDDEGSPGRRNMIADVYGAEERKRQLVKRIKTKNEQPSSASTPVSISSSNGMGKWMKEGEQKPSTSSAISDMVDLTKENTNTPKDDDDDELVCTGSADLSAQRVCYGKIDGAMVQSFSVPKPADTSFVIDENTWPSIKVELQRPANAPRGSTQIDVIDPHGHKFGKIDAKTAQGLCPLLDDAVVSTVEVTARLNIRRKLPHEVVGSPTSGFWHATINVYGQRQRADAIGKFLSLRNVWLGTPNSVENGTPTFNPHAEVRRQQAAAAAAASINRERIAPTIRYESRTAEEVNDAVTKMFDQLIKADIPTMEQPDGVLTPLLHHQKQALWFMTDKEQPRKFGPREEDNNSLWREVIRSDGRRQYKEIISGITMDQKPKEALGGLLADMMGLGKTLSILSLITSSLDQANEWTEMAPSPQLVRDVPGIRNTRTTLLVAPLSAVSNWVTQIRDHLKERTLSLCVFHGPTRTTDLDELSEYDIVITTYSTILSEISGRGAKAGRVSPLNRMNMFRIVLDEAHTIRERNAAQTRAIISLNANRRWSVTGTPIQNRMDDLFSVTNFLQIYPYSERGSFAQHISGPVKSGNPSLTNLRVIVDSFTLRRVKDRINLPPRDEQFVILPFSDKEKQLHDFFRNESQGMMNVIAGQNKVKMGGKMYHHVLKAMMILRQVSAHGKELLDTSDRERAKGHSANDAIDLEDGESDDTTSATEKQAYSMFDLMQQAPAPPQCHQCSEQLQEPLTSSGEVRPKDPIAFLLPCWCVFCPNCFSGYKDAFDSAFESGTISEIRCPSCDGWTTMNYSAITPEGVASHEAGKEREREARKVGKHFGDYEGPHTKTMALINYLQETVEKSKELVGEPPIKSVVFSAWTSHLDLIEVALTNNNLSGFTRLDGSMTLPARTRALEEFAKNDSITILLATIGAGGVGLNLTSASQVFIMEPQYNPAAVAQAVDRVHRLGQTRPVRIIQLIMKDSIEVKILELARKKQQEADMTMDRKKLDKREAQEARMREYRQLFKG